MSRRKGGLYVPLDVNFFDDPRIVRAGEKAAWLYLAMCAACKRLGEDGRLEPLQVDRLHVPSWRARMQPLLREQLVADFGDGFYTITSWLRHNEAQATIAKRRAEDAARKRGERPAGFRSDSVQSPNVREVERREREVGTPLLEDCEHGVDRHASCSQCASARLRGRTSA